MTDPKASPIETKVNDLIYICERMSAVLDKENLALENGAVGELDGLLKEKQMVCGAYESLGKSVMQDPAQFAQIDEETREHLRELLKTVDGKIAHNVKLLAVQAEVKRRIFDVLAETAKKTAPHSGVYSQSGKVDMGQMHALKGTPLSIDKTL